MNSRMDVFTSAVSFNEEEMRGKTAVVIDVMRASSTIIAALQNGAKGIIPVMDMDAAGRIAQNLNDPNFLLCGEKDGEKIQGYDLGNSPLEFQPATVEGKTIILNTTNGTRALKRSSMADEIYVAAFLNLDKVVTELKEKSNEIILVCAGWRGRLSLEDMLCAGAIIYELTGGELSNEARDGVKVAFGLYEKFGNDILDVVNNSNHAQRLQGVIHEEDIRFCCQVGVSDVLPKLEDGIIKNVHG